MRRYATQMEAARLGIVTPERKAVAAKSIRDRSKPENEDSYSMCGKFCAVRSMNKALNNQTVDLL